MRKDGLDEYTRPGGLARRDFLKIAGGGIIVAVSFDELSGLPQERRQGPRYPEDFNAYLRVGEDGRVTGFTGKIEMGQGAITSLPQMIADELDVPIDAVDMVLGDTDLCPWDMGTFGSQTTRYFGPALRAAAAEARAVLLELASEKLGVPKDRLSVRDGIIRDASRAGIEVSYAALAAGKRIERHITPKPPPKPVAEWRVMGKPFLHRDARDKVTGKALFAGDIRLPGMLYAKVLRPPAHGAALKSLDTSAAEKIAGVRILREKELVGVLHELPDAAESAVALVKAEYDVPKSRLDSDNIFEHLHAVAPEARVVAEGGDLAKGESAAASRFNETYLNGYVAHAPTEPHTALANVEGDRATVWASTQAPFRLKDEVAQTLGVPPENVRVITPFVGGGFGGKTRNIQAVQAVRLSKLAGKPVQVAWSRADEFFNDSFRPAAVVKIKSGMDGAGRIVFWDYDVLFAGDRSSAQFYDIPHHRTVSRGQWGGGAGAHPFAVGAWRAPGSNTNVFARESQIDVMAAKAGADPLEFRMRNLADERMKRASGSPRKVRLEGGRHAERPGGGHRHVGLPGDLRRHRGRGRRRPEDRRDPGQAGRLCPGHGPMHQSPRGFDPGRRVYNDGPRLRPDRGGPVQGRRGPRPEFRYLRDPALLVAPEDRGLHRPERRPSGLGRRRAGHHQHGRRPGQRGVRRDRGPPVPSPDDAGAGESGARRGAVEMNGKESTMDQGTIMKRTGMIVGLGAVWGLAECALGAGLQACARSMSGSLMTGVALFFIAAAWASSKRALHVGLLVVIAVLFKMFDAALLGLPLGSGAVANPAFAFVLEGAGFLALAAIVGNDKSARTSGRMLMGGGAALFAVGAFPLVGLATGTPACLAAGTSIPLSWYYGPIAAALSLFTVLLGMRFGERARIFESRTLAPSLALALSLILMVVFRMI